MWELIFRSMLCCVFRGNCDALWNGVVVIARNLLLVWLRLELAANGTVEVCLHSKFALTTFL
jgi:hypothetical protein